MVIKKKIITMLFLIIVLILLFLKSCTILFKEPMLNSKDYEANRKYYSSGKNVYVTPSCIGDLPAPCFDMFVKRKQGMDSNTLQLIAGPLKYAKDKNNVYYSGKIVKWANPLNFKVWYNNEFQSKVENINQFIQGTHDIGIDDKHLYINEYSIDIIDPNTVTILSDEYIKDKNHIYYIWRVDFGIWDYTKQESEIKKLYGNSLLFIEPMLYRYYLFIVQKDDIDINSFETVKSYAKDKNNIYYNGEIIKGADVKSFEVLEDYYTAKDKNNYYYLGKIKYD